MRLYAIPGGLLDGDKGLVLTNNPSGERLTVPVPYFLIEHPEGNVVFDTGMNKGCITDPRGTWGRVADFFTPIYEEGEDIVSQLARLGHQPSDIRYIVLSHLHFDHAGGNQWFPDSIFILQKGELHTARFPPIEARGAYRKVDFDHPLNYQEIGGEYDLFGDGTIVIIPTMGHTPGHQSLLVRLPRSGSIILVGDACHFREDWHKLNPRHSWNRDLAVESMKLLRRIQERENALVLFSHDGDQWAQIKKAPDYYD